MSALESAVRRFRAQLAAREARAVRRLVQDYHSVEMGIREELLFVLRGLDEGSSTASLFRRDRLLSLERDLIGELERLTGKTYLQILEEQGHAGRLAADHFAELLDLSMGAGPNGIHPSFARLNTAAVEYIVGALQDGSPLKDLMDSLPQHGAARFRQEIIRGVALGRSPTVTARRVAGALGGNLSRAIIISRTETLRAYRSVTHEGYRRNSAVVRGWVWSSSADNRTCPVCWAMDGTFHLLDEPFASHPACRCAMVPRTRTWAELGIPGVPDTGPTIVSGEAKFAALDDRAKLAVLGPAKFRAYSAGAIRLEDLVGVSESAAWGPGRFERSLSSILGTSSAARFSLPRVASSRSLPAAKPAATRAKKAPTAAGGGSKPPPRKPRAPTPAPGEDPLGKVKPSAAAMSRLQANTPRSASWFLRRRAEEAGMTVDAFKGALEDHLRELLSDATLAKRITAPDMIQALQDGRFKSLFETGRSGGAPMPSYRATKEQLMFGYPRGMSPERRPIYGYLYPVGDDPPYALSGQYGRVRVVFKDSLKDRTTFILDDSLNAIPAMAPSPVKDPKWYSHQIASSGPLEFTTLNEVAPYAEAQYHGGVTLADIARVDFHPGAADRWPELVDLLDELNIPWSFDVTLMVDPL